jgi:hypothetical protein
MTPALIGMLIYAIMIGLTVVFMLGRKEDDH